MTSLATAAPGAKVPAGSQAAGSADGFVGSIGVNVHLAYAQTPYADAAGVTYDLTSVGFRHIRDNESAGATNVLAEYQLLAQSGVKVDLIADNPSSSLATLTQWASTVGSVEAIEGVNEFDLSNTPNWAAVLDVFQTALYPAVKAALANVAVIAPALTSEAAYAQVGSLVGDANDNNMHDYFAGRNPGTLGYGATDALGIYGSLPWQIASARQPNPPLPMWSTETGYSDAVDQYAVPATTKLHYTLRTLFLHWNAGVARTYLYELIDEGPAPFSHYGFFDSGNNPKPALRGLKRLIAHLADPGPAFAPQPLAYTLTGNVSSTLLEKRNGTYSLIVWVEAPEWNPLTESAVAVAAQSVTLSFPAVPATVTETTFDSTGEVHPQTVTPAQALTLQANGSPTIIDIVP